MTLQLTVSPDFSPEHVAGWYVFNTWLQRRLGVRVHLELHDDFQQQHRAIEEDRVDLIFANPYDASMLVRQRGFQAIAAPGGEPDEVVVAVAANSEVHRVTDLPQGLRVAQTRDPDVRLIGMMLMEPADLAADRVQPVVVSSYVLVAKHLLLGRADVGLFLKKAYDSLSGPTQRQLRPIVTSEISVMRHLLLAGPRFAPHAEALRDLLLTMHEPGQDGGRVLEALALPGWHAQAPDDIDLMIDLMDALTR